MNKKQFIKKLRTCILKLLKRKEQDKWIYGNSFIEFTDRKVEVLEPVKVLIIRNKKGKVIGYKTK